MSEQEAMERAWKEHLANHHFRGPVEADSEAGFAARADEIERLRVALEEIAGPDIGCDDENQQIARAALAAARAVPEADRSVKCDNCGKSNGDVGRGWGRVEVLRGLHVCRCPCF